MYRPSVFLLLLSGPRASITGDSISSHLDVLLGTFVITHAQRGGANVGQHQREETQAVEGAEEDDQHVHVKEVETEIGEIGKIHGEVANEGGDGAQYDGEEHGLEGLCGPLGPGARNDHEDTGNVRGELNTDTHTHHQVNHADTVDLQTSVGQKAVDLEDGDHDTEHHEESGDPVEEEEEGGKEDANKDITQVGKQIRIHVEILLIEVEHETSGEDGVAVLCTVLVGDLSNILNVLKNVLNVVQPILEKGQRDSINFDDAIFVSLELDVSNT